MEDREMLEYAAKAYGLPKCRWLKDKKLGPGLYWWDETRNGKGIGCNVRFDPMNDDVDAFRIVVKLGMYICVNLDPAGFSAIATLQSPTQGARVFVETNDSDRYASTRRAIVRAAAAIGKAMS